MATVDIYGGVHPIEVAAYTISDAAHHLRIATSTLRDWVKGRPSRRDGRRESDAIILLAEPANKRGPRLLSFRNLIEAHVLAGMRLENKVPLEEVREAIAHVRHETGLEHPLAEAAFYTDGYKLFIERAGRFIDATGDPQQWLKAYLDAALRRVDRDPKGLAFRLYPFLDEKHREERGDDKPILIDPKRSFGRPILVEAGAPTSIIASRRRAGEGADELAYDYGVPRAQIEAALRYEGFAEAA